MPVAKQIRKAAASSRPSTTAVRGLRDGVISACRNWWRMRWSRQVRCTLADTTSGLAAACPG